MNQERSVLDNAALEHLAQLMPVRDFVSEEKVVQESFCDEPQQEHAVEQISRILFRTSEDRHSILTGVPGTGLTTTLLKFGLAVLSGKVLRFRIIEYYTLMFGMLPHRLQELALKRCLKR